MVGASYSEKGANILVLGPGRRWGRGAEEGRGEEGGGHVLG